MIDHSLRATLIYHLDAIYARLKLVPDPPPWWSALQPGDVVQATDPAGCLVYLADRLTLWPAGKPPVRSRWPMPLTAAPLPDPPQEGAGAWLQVNRTAPAGELWVRSEAVVKVV